MCVGGQMIYLENLYAYTVHILSYIILQMDEGERVCVWVDERWLGNTHKPQNVSYENKCNSYEKKCNSYVKTIDIMIICNLHWTRVNVCECG